MSTETMDTETMNPPTKVKISVDEIDDETRKEIVNAYLRKRMNGYMSRHRKKFYEYTKAYYERNSKEISKKNCEYRRKRKAEDDEYKNKLSYYNKKYQSNRYKNDPEYREKVKQRNKEAYQKRKAKKQQQATK